MGEETSESGLMKNLNNELQHRKLGVLKIKWYQIFQRKNRAAVVSANQTDIDTKLLGDTSIRSERRTWRAL